MSRSQPLTGQPPVTVDWLRHLNAENRRRLVILAGLIAGITLGHYLVAIQLHHYHDIFRRLYYLPIILGGLWFQLRGGLASAIVVSIVYAPHIAFQWGAHPDAQWEQYLEIILYHVVGGLTGLLAHREHRQQQKLEQTARNLDESYRKLKEQAQQILTFEEQLLRASRLSALGELAAGLAHEIRNPLGSIRGTAEIVKDAATSPEQRSEFAEILVREVDRLNLVVTHFLRFARPAPLGKQTFNLNHLLEELCEFSFSDGQCRHLEVHLVPAELPPVPVDAEQIRQVFLNLLLNAAQAMPEGGCLQISTHLQDDSVMVRFADNGPGITADLLPKIFNPFVTTKQTGTGLGLAISQRIVQAHGGRIRVESHAGQGTTFEVSIPLAEA